jgi:hypothetical protein
VTLCAGICSWLPYTLFTSDWTSSYTHALALCFKEFAPPNAPLPLSAKHPTATELVNAGLLRMETRQEQVRMQLYHTRHLFLSQDQSDRCPAPLLLLQAIRHHLSSVHMLHHGSLSHRHTLTVYKIATWFSSMYVAPQQRTGGAAAGCDRVEILSVVRGCTVGIPRAHGCQTQRRQQRSTSYMISTSQAYLSLSICLCAWGTTALLRILPMLVEVPYYSCYSAHPLERLSSN